MRRKLFAILTLALLFCVSILCLNGCSYKEPEHEHAFNQKIAIEEFAAKNATCTEKARYYYSCDCGAKGVETFEHGFPLDHDYGSWIYNGNDTHTKICANDSGHFVTENCSGGTATCAKKAICMSCNTSYGNLADHKYDVIKYNATEHWYACSCGDKRDVKAHIPGTPATETSSQTCTECEYIITPALGHVHNLHLTKVNAKVQSCTEEGNIEYYTCSCGKWFTNSSATTEIFDKDSVIIGTDKHKQELLKKNETEHWYECSCGYEINMERHKGGIATCQVRATCDVCNVVYGDFGGCNYVNGICIVCGYIIGTDGLQYSLIKNNTEYAVSGYIGASDEVYIPTTYNNLPVTSISEWAFSDCSLLTSIKIPNSIKTIEPFAFRNCSLLPAIEIPNSVTSIGGGAFWGCSQLTNIEIPNSVLDIGGSAFYGCTSLEGATVGNRITEISGCLFQNCTSLASIEIPDGVISIGQLAFSGCTSLKSINIPDSVTFIGGEAFSNCDAIENAIMPTLAAGRFSGKSLKEVVLTSGYSIKDFAFKNCSLLTSVEIPDSVTSIGEGAFSGCISLLSVEIPDSVTSIGAGIFSGCISIEKIKASSAIIESVPKENLREVIITKGAICESAFRNCTSLINVTIYNTVTSIGEFAFYGCASLVYNEKDGLKYLGSDENKYLYLDSSNCFITTANIDDNCRFIGGHVFDGCSSLEIVKVPSNVSYISYNLFKGLGSLISIIVDENNANYKSIDGNLYSKDGRQLIQYSIGKSETLFIVPEEVTDICDSAFAGCSSLTNVIISENVTSIGQVAFYGCISLTSIIIPENVEYLGWAAFSSCYSLTTICCNAESQPDGWSSNWFGDCAADIFWGYGKDLQFELINNDTEYEVSGYVGTTTEVYIPSIYNGKYVTRIGDSAFQYCDSLVTVVIPDSVRSIGDYAFGGCNSLTSIEVSENNQYYRDIDGNLYSNDGRELIQYALAKTETVFAIPSTVTSICCEAFAGCYALTSIEIPNSVTSIDYGAFGDCGGLTKVNYTGTIDQWVQIYFSNTSANPLYNAKNLYINNQLVTEAKITTATKIKPYVFSGCNSLKSIVISEAATSIADHAFYRCSSLISIVMSNSVTYIDNWAFLDCGSLARLYYVGTAEDWGEISIGIENFYLTNATRYYYIENEIEVPNDGGNYWRYDENGEIYIL